MITPVEGDEVQGFSAMGDLLFELAVEQIIDISTHRGAELSGLRMKGRGRKHEGE
jgi:hypothetical protein